MSFMMKDMGVLELMEWVVWRRFHLLRHSSIRLSRGMLGMIPEDAPGVSALGDTYQRGRTTDVNSGGGD